MESFFWKTNFSSNLLNDKTYMGNKFSLKHRETSQFFNVKILLLFFVNLVKISMKIVTKHH